MKINIIEVNQPIGTFYLTSMKAPFLLERLVVNRRELSSSGSEDTGIQRRLSDKRVREIANYTMDPDATFPTAIILNVSTEECNARVSNGIMSFDESKFKAEIIDGQHRIFALKESECADAFELPIVILFDLTEEEKAYIFSTINGNQQKVDKSLVYDLFGLAQTRSPHKTAHEIARTMNCDERSPLRNRLKMLGRMVTGEETLSQGAFVKYLVDLISKDPQKDLVDEKRGLALTDDENLPFRYYYINKKDEYILKVLINYFGAFAEVFHNEWSNSRHFMLSRSTGFGAMMLALRTVAERGLFEKRLNQQYFAEIANRLKALLRREKLELTTEEFPSNIQQQRRLERMIIASTNSQT
jgi:DGQHR domain-containing protein